MRASEQSEYAVTYALKHRGIKCKAMGRLKKPWDIETSNGLRIEVKDSDLHRGMWVVNLEAGQDRKADFLVIALRGLTGLRGTAQRLFVVLKTPIKKTCWH